MKEKNLIRRLATAPYILWSVLFIVVPMIMVIYYAFTDGDGAFTFDNITQIDKFTDIFIRSIRYALISTAICLVIAYPLAYIISKARPSRQKILLMLIMLPMWTNFLLRTYSMMNLLNDTGIINNALNAIGLDGIRMINTQFAVIFGMVYNFLPYMILPIYTVMLKLDKSSIEAAQDLGCNTFGVLTKIIIPLTMPGVVSGITMVFVPSISTFYISQKLGGGTSDLIGDVIERQFMLSNNFNLGASLSLVLMVLILVSLAVLNRFTDGDEGGMVV